MTAQLDIPRERSTGWIGAVLSLELKKLTAYRVDFWMRAVISVFSKVALAYYLWRAMFSQHDAPATIGGYSFEAMMCYYVVMALASNVINATFDLFASEIYDGSLTRYLLYPVSFFPFKLASCVAPTILGLFQLGVGLTLLPWLIDLPPSALTISAVCCGVCSTIIATYLLTVIRAVLEFCAFWAESVWSLSVALYFLTHFLGGGVVPLALFPSWAQEIIRWSPFPQVLATPVEAFLGRFTIAEWGAQTTIALAWCGVFTLIDLVVLRRGIRHYSSVGI